jgi:hypothetical protein
MARTNAKRPQLVGDSQSDSPDAIAFVVHAAAAECRLPAAMGSIDRCSFELG